MSVPKLNSASHDRLPTKTSLSPISPAYAQVLRNRYQKSEYSYFLPAIPHSRTSTLPKEECRMTGKRHRPETPPRRWKSEVNMGLHIPVSASNPRGLMVGNTLERHGMEEIYCQESNTFPKCLGMKRMYTESHLYPQYGDLKSRMFKQRLPPPIPDGPRLSRARLEVMKQQDAKYNREKEEALLNGISDNRATHGEDRWNALPFDIELDEIRNRLPAEEKKAVVQLGCNRVEQVSPLELEIKERLEIIAVERNARRDAFRKHTRQGRVRQCTRKTT
ncbi:uncharacterized protein K460DRAFT_416624 [Cucurbitaria berberidis CBS 394.84]|uniref:Enkurin domain-containing protein n=1 Tax=Cucurbitaria berberidis CBS 394.84 TaxID=1168544 RepID=A0A9P4GHQ2_9PLEO|nr:uncharacterized protein K460DRAFT_416624 [Cucurbitaria berberidis CBS 394.84]KAF1845350.1 hypothetical protein K460DRAFT_416624 [Cucurbitaria berberidis CBS 394.84]